MAENMMMDWDDTQACWQAYQYILNEASAPDILDSSIPMSSGEISAYEYLNEGDLALPRLIAPDPAGVNLGTLGTGLNSDDSVYASGPDTSGFYGDGAYWTWAPWTRFPT